MLIRCGGAAFTVVFDIYQFNWVCETFTFATVKIPKTPTSMQAPDHTGAFFLLFIYEDLVTGFVRVPVNLNGDLSKIKIEIPDRLSFFI